MSEMQDDSEQLQIWWNQCLAADTKAFGLIHAALFTGLYNYGLRLLNDDELASDAIQDLFIKIWGKRNSIGNLQKVKPFFYTALRRQILNQLRDLKLKQYKIRFIIQPDMEFSQEEILIKKEADAGLENQIVALLNSLPKRQQEIIYLHYFENIPLNQIAEILGINQQSAINLKYRALQKMRLTGLPFIFLFLYSACYSEKF